MLILASASPRRRKILKDAGIKFRVIPSHAHERYPAGTKPQDIVQLLALRKARSIARQYPSDVILGADTIVFARGRVIGKPVDHRHAEKILRTLSGAWQKVYTGVAIVADGGKTERVGYAVSSLKFRKLTEEEILCAGREHMDKAGAYAIQETGDDFVERLAGDLDNVVGLPMRLVRRLLGGRGLGGSRLRRRRR